MNRILIVEDDLHMQQGLHDNLAFEGYDVTVAPDGASGLQKMLHEPYDLVLLDVMLPALSGFDVCRRARAAGCQTPVIMLTAKGEEIDKVLGLELGADDYVTKPFSLRELLARVRAVLRRRPVPSTEADAAAESCRIGRLDVHFDTYEAYEGDTPVALTHLEFEVLKYLYTHRGEVVSRDDLLADVWGYADSPTTRTIDNFILKLRQKLEEDPSAPRHILTVHGVGYKFILP